MTAEELEKRHREVLANAKPDEDGWDVYYVTYKGESDGFKVDVARGDFFNGKLTGVGIDAYYFDPENRWGAAADVRLYLLDRVPRWEEIRQTREHETVRGFTANGSIVTDRVESVGYKFGPHPLDEVIALLETAKKNLKGILEEGHLEANHLGPRDEIHRLIEPAIRLETSRSWNQDSREPDPSFLAFLVADLILETYKLEKVKS